MESTGTEVRRPGLAPLVVMAAALLVRLVYFLEHLASPFFAVPLLDAKYYHLFAQALSTGGDLAAFGGFRPVLYPVYLSAYYTLFGADSGIILALLGQHVLGVATAGMVCVIAGRVFRDKRAGLAAGLVYALAGPPLYFEGELLIASFLTFLLVAMLSLVVLAETNKGRHGIWLWVGAGVLLGLAVQARPNALVLLPSFVILPIVHYWRRRIIAWGPLAATGAMIALMIVFGFVNKAHSGRYQLVTGAGGINFYVGNNQRADGMIPRQPESVSYTSEYRDSLQVYSEVAYARAMRDQGKEPSTDPGAVSDFWVRKGLAEIGSDPGRWAGLMMKKAWLVLWNHEVANNKSYSFIVAEESWILGVMPVHWWMLVALLPIGLWTVWRRASRALLLFLLLYLCLYAAGIVAFFVNSRFRIPLWPVMSILAGGAIIACVEFARERHARRLMTFGALFAAGAVVSLPNWFAVPGDDWARDYFFRAVANQELGRFEDAIRDGTRSIELDSANPDALMALGNAFFASGRMEDAIAVYTKYLAMEPSEPRAWNNVGVAWEQLGAYADAYNAYLSAIVVAPDYAGAHINAALLEIRAGMLEEAGEKIAVAESLTGVRPDLLCAKAFLLRGRGEEGQAAVLIETARAMAPVYTETLIGENEQKISRRNLVGE